MHIYTQAMYQAWCQEQSEEEITYRYATFVKLSSIAMATKESEMLEYLKKTKWFLYPKSLR